jgi:tetratricopeptide (TPR) repeat protein
VAGIYNSPPGSAEFTAAFDLCDRALHIDNGNVLALTGMTLRYITPVVEAQSSDPQADTRRADELVTRALAIDPNFYVARFAKAYVLVAQGRTEEAVAEGERSLALNPSFIDAYLALCAANNFLGRPDRALELADKAIRLSPRDPFLRVLYHMKGWAFFMKGQDDRAIEWLRRAEGGDVFTDLILAAALALTGQQADAHETLKRYLAVNGITTTTIAQLRKQQLSLADNSTWVAYNERLFEGLRKAGMPEQ